MRLFSLGMMMGIITCMIILCYIPIPETEQACYNCGLLKWWHKITEGE